MSSEQLERFVARLAAEPWRWRHLVRHEHDVRVYEQIAAEEDVNAWLICWSEDADTGFHDHDVSGAAITVVSGSVREFEAPQRFNIPPNAIHRVIHAGEQPAITLHAYSPPLTRMGAYTVGPQGELERQALTCEQELRAEQRTLDPIQ